MDLKKSINQIYEFRLLQSSKAIITSFLKYKQALPTKSLSQLKEDKNFIDCLHRKFIRKKKVSKKEFKTLLDVYLLYSKHMRKIYERGKKLEGNEKLMIFFLLLFCIKVYFSIEKELSILIGEKDENTNEIIQFTNIAYNVIYELIRDNKDKDFSYRNIVWDLKEKEQMLIEIEDFMEDCMDEIIYPVKHEYDRRKIYQRRENQILISGMEKIDCLVTDILAYKYYNDKKSSSL